LSLLTVLTSVYPIKILFTLKK